MEIDDILVICNAYEEGKHAAYLAMPFNNPYPDTSANYVAYHYGYSSEADKREVVTLH